MDQFMLDNSILSNFGFIILLAIIFATMMINGFEDTEEVSDSRLSFQSTDDSTLNYVDVHLSSGDEDEDDDFDVDDDLGLDDMDLDEDEDDDFDEDNDDIV